MQKLGGGREMEGIGGSNEESSRGSSWAGEATPTRLVLREHWSVGGAYHKAEHSVCNVAQNTLPT